MKRKMAVMLAAVLGAATMLAGCSGNQASNEYVTVGGYKGIEVDKVQDKEKVEDEDIENYITSVQEQNTEEVTDRAAKEGDTVNIDFVGKMNGEEFEGGSSQGYDLKLGSGQFIDGFEDSIVGHNKGETFDWNGKFPDPYTGNPDFSGKDVTFTITVNSINQLPEVNDAFVKKVTKEDSKNVKEYKEEIKETLEKNAEENYKYNLATEAWDAVMEKAKFDKKPEKEIKKMKDEIIDQYKQYAKYYNVSYEELIQSQMNTDVKSFEKQASEVATDTVKAKYVAQAIADKENLTPSKDEYQKEFKKMAKQYGYDDVDALVKDAGEDELKDIVLQNVVKEWLADNCVQVVNDSDK